jgi:hypothetical protein
MPVGYAEARNIVFPQIDIVAALFGHENLNSHQSVPFGSDLFDLRPEWISSFHSDASAQRSRGTVPRSDVHFEISPGRLWASGDSGALLLINRYVPLALTILGPIIVNILLFHGLMNPAGIGLAVFVTIFWGVVFVSVRSAFAAIFEARVETKTSEVRRQARVISPA